MRALLPQLGAGARFVHCRLLLRKCIDPAAIDPFVDEHFRAGVPERPAEGHTLGGVLLHPVEGTVVEDIRPARFANRNFEERGQAPDLTRKIALEIGEVECLCGMCHLADNRAEFVTEGVNKCVLEMTAECAVRLSRTGKPGTGAPRTEIGFRLSPVE